MSSFSYAKDLSRISRLGMNWWRKKWTDYPDVMASMTLFFGSSAVAFAGLSYQKATDPYKYAKYNDYYKVIREEDAHLHGEKATVFN